MNAPVQTNVTMLRQKGSFHVTGATVDDPKVQTRLQTVQEGQQYQVWLNQALKYKARLEQLGEET